MLERESLTDKIKSLGGKNKKLLESISTHLINYPDQSEVKVQEHKNLIQKYNELISFSQDNVTQNEKIQQQIYSKNEKIEQLKEELMYFKEKVFQYEEKIKKEYAEIQRKQEEDHLSYQQIIQKLKEESQQLKRSFNKQKKKLSQELQSHKNKLAHQQKEYQNVQENYLHEKCSYEEKIRSMQQIIQQQKSQIIKLNKDSKVLEEELGKKVKKDTLLGVKDLIGDYKKRNT